MPLFMCATYWYRKMENRPDLCSECDPSIGKWHGKFPKRTAVGMLVDQNGHLWRTDGALPKHYQIIGSVAEGADQ